MYEFLFKVLEALKVGGSYAVAVILFTLIVRVVLFPFDFRSRRSMRKMANVQPKVAVLQKKYANDRDKLNRKMQELYRQEGVSPLSGCLPMLLSYPILIIMFGAMRFYAADQMVLQVTDFLKNVGADPHAAPNYEKFIWIKNLFMADNPFTSALPDINTLTVNADSFRKMLTVERMNDIIAVWNTNDTWLASINGTAELKAAWEQIVANIGRFTTQDEWLNFLRDTKVLTAESKEVTVWSQLPGLFSSMMANTEFYKANIGPAMSSPIMLLGTLQKHWNGLMILPIMSAASQFLMTKLNPSQNQPAAAGDPQAQTAQSTGKFMTWFFPIFSLVICFSSTAAFSLYWVVSNLIAMVQTVVLNKYFENKEQKDKIVGEGIVQ